MIRIAFDTNVILDAATGRPGAEEALALMQALIQGEITGLVTANSITDIHYLVKKHAGEEKARLVVSSVLALFDIASVDGEACLLALNTPMADYEDALLAVCAQREGAVWVVTRDEGWLHAAGSPLPALHPREALRRLREEA